MKTIILLAMLIVGITNAQDILCVHEPAITGKGTVCQGDVLCYYLSTLVYIIQYRIGQAGVCPLAGPSEIFAGSKFIDPSELCDAAEFLAFEDSDQKKCPDGCTIRRYHPIATAQVPNCCTKQHGVSCWKPNDNEELASCYFPKTKECWEEVNVLSCTQLGGLVSPSCPI